MLHKNNKFSRYVTKKAKMLGKSRHNLVGTVSAEHSFSLKGTTPPIFETTVATDFLMG
jgi:hypothetical protein